MKIVISRKGADSSTEVAHPSPIFPDGSYFSVPVEGGECKHVYGWVEYCGHNVGNFLNDLGGFDPASKSKKKSIDWRRRYVHLDPDLDFDSSYVRHSEWKPNLGQQGNPLRHLLKQGVGVGDLFLFFGQFQKVEQVERRWRYVRNAPKQHIFFGYLQVKEVVSGRRAYRKQAWLKGHPHDYPGAKKGSDAIFIGGGDLCLGGVSTGLPSGNMFPKVLPKRVLTKDGATKPNFWSVPDWLEPKGRTPLTLHGNEKRWGRDDKGLTLECVGRGQEFVLDTDKYPSSLEWVADIIGAQ